MSENLEELTPNQRRALDKALAALETMAAMWGAEIRIHDVAQRLAAKPDAERAKAIAAFIEQAFIEGAYRHYLDRDPAANPELERASQPGSGEAVSGAEWLALANQAHALKASREKAHSDDVLRRLVAAVEGVTAAFDGAGSALSAALDEQDAAICTARASLDGRREG